MVERPKRKYMNFVEVMEDLDLLDYSGPPVFKYEVIRNNILIFVKLIPRLLKYWALIKRNVRTLH